MKIRKKLRDLSVEELEQYCSENGCASCALRWLSCSSRFEAIREHKDIFNDKFLDQKIEIEVEDVLTNKEKDFLFSLVELFGEFGEVKKIKKCSSTTQEKEWLILGVLNITSEIEYVSLPEFKKGTMFKGMEYAKEYTLEELGLKQCLN